MRHGIAKGFVLGAARILRCSQLFAGGNDPVPYVHRWKLIFAWIARNYQRFWKAS